MTTGMTIKQMARAEFFAALDAYREALRTKHNLVAASLRVQVAKAGVPKRLWPAVNKAFRGGGK